MSFTTEKAKELLAASHAQGRLAHAYLITGPEGSGKRELVIHVMGLVNELDLSGIDSPESLRSATTSVIRPESKSRRITVNAIREAEHTLQLAAPGGVTKFAVILEADRMGQEAENAFLKTLEEPPRASMLFLVSAHPEQLLETILSRCIRVPLIGTAGPVKVGQAALRLLTALKDHTMEGNPSVSSALGLMGRFSAVLKEEKAAIQKRNDEAMKAESAHYKQTTEGDWLKRREEYYKALTESEYLAARDRLIEYLVAWFGDALRQQNGSPHLDLPDFSGATGKLARELDSGELGRKIDGVEELRMHLNTNVQEVLALEAGFVRVFS